MKNNDEILKKAARESAEKIGSSALFLCLFNEAMIDEVLPLIQMGLAVYLDKPIYLLVPESRVLKIPENLRAMARRIEVYPDDNVRGVEEATSRLLKEHIR